MGSHRIIRIALGMVLCVVADRASAGQGDGPSGSGPTSQPAISDEAKPILQAAADAYAKVKSIELSGTLTSDMEAGRMTQKGTVTFETKFLSPSRFTFQSKGMGREWIVGSTGAIYYYYDKETNSHSYTLPPAENEPMPPEYRVTAGAVDLCLAALLRPKSFDELTAAATTVVRTADVKVDGIMCPSLKMTMKGAYDVTLSFDPSTHFFRRMLTDARRHLEQLHLGNIGNSTIELKYSAIRTDVDFKADQFEWTPPAGSKGPDMGPGINNGASDRQSLVGKPSPRFKLKRADGADVDLAAFNGKVVVYLTCGLDDEAFLTQLNDAYPALSKEGVIVMAVDLNPDETPERLRAFVDKTKLKVPMLGDKDAKMIVYGANCSPGLVVVGKNGQVVKDMAGFDKDTTLPELREAIAQAMK